MIFIENLFHSSRPQITMTRLGGEGCGAPSSLTRRLEYQYRGRTAAVSVSYGIEHKERLADCAPSAALLDVSLGSILGHHVLDREDDVWEKTKLSSSS